MHTKLEALVNSYDNKELHRNTMAFISWLVGSKIPGLPLETLLEVLQEVCFDDSEIRVIVAIAKEEGLLITVDGYAYWQRRLALA